MLHDRNGIWLVDNATKKDSDDEFCKIMTNIALIRTSISYRISFLTIIIYYTDR